MEIMMMGKEVSPALRLILAKTFSISYTPQYAPMLEMEVGWILTSLGDGKTPRVGLGDPSEAKVRGDLCLS